MISQTLRMFYNLEFFRMILINFTPQKKLDLLQTVMNDESVI